MRVFTASEINFLENSAVQTGVSLASLMENAGNFVAELIIKKTDIKNKRIVILCGKGNNGGDGFVCAKKLSENSGIVSVILVQGNIKTDIARDAFEKMGEKINVVRNNLENKYCSELLKNADIIVDAIFGIGFKGEIAGIEKDFIETANNTKALKFAVDLPSGTHCDNGNTAQTCFKADYTATFTALKPVHLVEPAKEFCGEVEVFEVGIKAELMGFLPEFLSLIDEKEISNYFKPRKANTHKGTYGRLLMICGSYSMIGAGIMAAKSALRSGVGLLDVVVSRDCYPIMASAVPEAVFTITDFSSDESTKKSSDLILTSLKKASACVVGCGLGEDCSRYVESIVKFANCPVVLDADALNFLANNLEILKEKHCEIVITPHPKEMSRLKHSTVSQIQSDRIETAKSFSKENNLHTILKGSGTIIANPDGEVQINTTGNAGMAKGGSGDVLAGIVGSFLAQGFPVNIACQAAVFIHGKAGDEAAKKLSQTAMLPTDLIEFLPKVFKSFEK